MKVPVVFVRRKINNNLYHCRYGKGVQRTKWQALTISRAAVFNRWGAPPLGGAKEPQGRRRHTQHAKKRIHICMQLYSAFKSLRYDSISGSNPQPGPIRPDWSMCKNATVLLTPLFEPIWSQYKWRGKLFSFPVDEKEKRRWQKWIS